MKYAVYHQIDGGPTLRIESGLTAAEASSMADRLDATSVSSSKYFAEPYEGPIYRLTDTRYGEAHSHVTAATLRDSAVRILGDTKTTFEERSDGIYSSNGDRVADLTSK